MNINRFRELADMEDECESITVISPEFIERMGMAEIISTPVDTSRNKNLATIRVIKSLTPIDGADKIELCKFEEVEWQSVVKKGEFKVGDVVVYVQIDTVLPDGAAWAQFLKDKNLPGEPIRLKTAKLRGTLSQGLALPLSVIPGFGENRHRDTNELLNYFVVTGENEHTFVNTLSIGSDVTKYIGVTKYEKPVGGAPGEARGNFPLFLRKTDEERIQNYPRILHEEYGAREVYITLKMDGTSGTFYHRNGEIGACSRNLDLVQDDSSTYWKIGNELGIFDALKAKGNYSLQGEICGPGQQKNKIGLTKTTFYAFNLWNIDEQMFCGYDELSLFCANATLNMVPVLKSHVSLYELELDTVEKLLSFANSQTYANGEPAEGIVVRPIVEGYSRIMDGRLSFKVISNVFAAKHKE